MANNKNTHLTKLHPNQKTFLPFDEKGGGIVSGSQDAPEQFQTNPNAGKHLGNRKPLDESTYKDPKQLAFEKANRK